MNERREKRKRWVQRGRYAVEVEAEVVYPVDRPAEACIEPATVRWLAAPRREISIFFTPPVACSTPSLTERGHAHRVLPAPRGTTDLLFVLRLTLEDGAVEKAWKTPLASNPR